MYSAITLCTVLSIILSPKPVHLIITRLDVAEYTVSVELEVEEFSTDVVSFQGGLLRKKEVLRIECASYASLSEKLEYLEN